MLGGDPFYDLQLFERIDYACRKVTTSHRLVGCNSFTAGLHPTYISQHEVTDCLFSTSIERRFVSIF